MDEEDCKEDCNCAGCLLVNTPDDESPMPNSEFDDKQEDKEHEPPQLKHTWRKNKKAALDSKELLPKVLKVLDTIHAEGLSLSIFLDTLGWGDNQCTTSDCVCYAHMGLLLSEELLGILLCWYKPPHNKNKGCHPVEACHMLNMFSIDCPDGVIECQMEHLAPHFSLPPPEIFKTHLREFSFKALIGIIKREAPLVWSVVAWFSHSNKQQLQSTHKDLDIVLKTWPPIE
ncbi:hypothetical protein PAXRUDRAFT_141003 [Paxillus rubicundulus Ve08.2h10]|uniref:Uncharacterized protein n=1 Tax=Paxillus rubicundulus Ve08.2h10 TaxID=930991 RepID=A0A0D0E8W3_9AGAM|nr:hypothetical protein PAXRUDRAFT_141003 [Paxillus rubicundulus Ve08.2h10]